MQGFQERVSTEPTPIEKIFTSKDVPMDNEREKLMIKIKINMMIFPPCSSPIKNRLS